MGLDRENRQNVIVFVMGCVLCSIHFEVLGSFVGVYGGTGDVDVWLLSQFISLC
jgi:hypothetical protein